MATPSLISFSSGSIAAGGIGTTLTYAHTVPTGATALVIGVAMNDGNQDPNHPSAVFYASVAATKVVDVSSGANDTGVQLWHLGSPTVGTSSVLVKFNSLNYVGSGALSYNGTLSTTPTIKASLIGTAGSVTGIITPVTDNSLAVDVLSTESNPSVIGSGTPNTISRWANGNQSFQWGQGADKWVISPAASATFKWDNTTGNTWSWGAMVVEPAATGTVSPNLLSTLNAG